MKGQLRLLRSLVRDAGFALSLLVIAAPALAVDFAVPAHPFDIILGRPTDRAVTVSVLVYQDGDGYIEFGRTDSGTTATTPVRALTTGQAVEFTLDGLEPDAPYTYRLFWRAGTTASRTQTSPYAFHTARRPGSSFTFDIQADSHLDSNTSMQLYAMEMGNIAADRPDFIVDLGDTFMTDKYQQFRDAMPQYFAQRYYCGLASASAPLFLTIGNHDGEIGWSVDGTPNSMPVWSATLRTRLFPNPVPDSFYSGNPTPDPHVGLLQNYFAFTWGDALVVVLDPFWPTRTQTNGVDNWNWTIGNEQYAWLRSTLEASNAPLKFVFVHHLVGGFGKDRRGGVEAAALWEWGGANADGSPGFASHRPGWPETLHALFVRTGVSAVFHGHDHVYAKQDLDGIVYQELPQPAFPRPDSTGSSAEYGYVSGVIVPGAGHLRVRVDGGNATIEFVRAVLPQYETSTRHNREVGHTYTITGKTPPRPMPRRRAVRP